MTLVKDMYDELAVITGFPIYTNETDTPDTTRLLLSTLSLALHNIIDNLYIQNNVLERTDTIVTTPHQSEYGIEGIIKNIQIKDKHGVYRNLPYIDNINFHSKELDKKEGMPSGYVIRKGYLKLLPVPDDSYEVVVTVSTTDLVLSDNDTSRTSIEDINDVIIGSDNFCRLVTLRAASILFMKANNINAKIYGELCNAQLRTYIEHDYGTTEARRGFADRAGNYNPDQGLLG